MARTRPQSAGIPGGSGAPGRDLGPADRTDRPGAGGSLEDLSAWVKQALSCCL